VFEALYVVGCNSSLKVENLVLLWTYVPSYSPFEGL